MTTVVSVGVAIEVVAEVVASVGAEEGLELGLVGIEDGSLVGEDTGASNGAGDGAKMGAEVGPLVGEDVVASKGAGDGAKMGTEVGPLEGTEEGFAPVLGVRLGVKLSQVHPQFLNPILKSWTYDCVSGSRRTCSTALKYLVLIPSMKDRYGVLSPMISLTLMCLSRACFFLSLPESVSLQGSSKRTPQDCDSGTLQLV